MIVYWKFLNILPVLVPNSYEPVSYKQKSVYHEIIQGYQFGRRSRRSSRKKVFFPLQAQRQAASKYAWQRPAARKFVAVESSCILLLISDVRVITPGPLFVCLKLLWLFLCLCVRFCHLELIKDANRGIKVLFVVWGWLLIHCGRCPGMLNCWGLCVNVSSLCMRDFCHLCLIVFQHQAAHFRK